MSCIQTKQLVCKNNFEIMKVCVTIKCMNIAYMYGGVLRRREKWKRS